MARFLSKFLRVRGKNSPAEGELLTEAAELPPAEDSAKEQIAAPAPEGRNEPAAEFEFRKATDEELSATFLSEQDFADIARVRPGTGIRTLDGVKDIRRAEAKVPAAGPAGGAPPVVQTADGGAARAEDRPLIGYWDGLVVGKFLRGWAGDPLDPACRTVRVAVHVDGQEVASELANMHRDDTPHAGFEIAFADKRIAQYLVEDRVTIQATLQGGRTSEIIPLPVILDLARDYRSRELEREGRAVGSLPPAPKLAGDLSAIRVPVGLTSPNNAAITGKDGFLFAYRGPHNVIGQYLDPRADMVAADVAAWLEIFERRSTDLTARGVSYVQTVLPEKATILSSLAPPGFTAVTPRLNLVERSIAEKNRGDEPAPYYRSLVAALRSCHGAGIAPYLRLGDGFRTIGAQLAFYQLVQSIAAYFPDQVAEFDEMAALCSKVDGGKESAPLTGELAQQFLLPIYETEMVPDLGELGSRQPAAVNRVWKNEAATCQLKISIFGPPEAESPDEPTSIYWWFKRLFAETRIFDGRNFNLNVVEKSNSDVALFMMPERSLHSEEYR